MRGHRRDGQRSWPALAGVLVLALAATGTVAVIPPAVAQVAVPTVTVGTVVGASGPTVVPVTVAGFGNAPGLLAVLSLPVSSGLLEVDPSGLDVTAVPGSHWSGDRSLSFTGSVADVTTALQSRLSWHPPLQGAQPELEVVVREHVPGTVYDPVSGHDFEIVVTWSSWPDAKASAASSRLHGRPGYLATLTSQRESDLVAPHVAQARRDLWLGASDDWREVNTVAGTSYADQAEAEGQWHWVTGPEAGTHFWSGGADGGVLPGQFVNWWEGEPNDFGSGEHYAGMYEDGGTWNDWGGGGQSYLVEYGGSPGEVSTARSATATRTVTNLSALQVLQQYAEGSGPAPTAELYAVLGVAGVEGVTVSAVNSVLVRRGAAAVSSAADVTALVDAYRDVLAAARDEDGAAQVTAPDLTLLGAPVLPQVAAVLDTALRRLGPAAVDTADEVAALAVTVQQVRAQPSSLVLTAADSHALIVLGEVLQESARLTVLELETVSGVVARVFTAAGTLTPDDLVRLGAPGVTPDNRVAVSGALGTPASLVQLRAAVAEAVLAAQTAARAVLTAHSSGGAAPTTADYANAGVVGVGPGLLAAVNSVLAERHAVAVPAGVQPVVDAYAKVLGTAADPDYSPALTVEDLAALGLVGVTPADLGRVVVAVAQTADDGSQVQPLPVLRPLVSRATTAAAVAAPVVAVPVSAVAGTTRAVVSVETPGGRLVLRLEGVTRSGVLDVRTAPVSSRSPAHLDVGAAFVLDVGALDVTSVRVCLPVDAAALPAGLSVGEVRVLQVVGGRRVDVTSRAGRDQQGVCGSSRTVGEFVLGAETVARRSGPDRYATAAAASAARFAPGVPVVYLASGRSYADALAGGAGAAALDGPLLLVGSRPSFAVTEELERLRPARIAVLGGPGALPAGLERSLDPFTDGPVTRLAGADRYSTAAATSRDAFPLGASTAYLASGESYADAIAGGAAAAADGAPLLLSAGSRLPESTLAELARLGADRVVLLGGTDVLGAELLTQLRSRGLEVERRAGSDRYGTAASAAVSAFPRGAEVVYLASGTTFADALASVAISADSRAPVLLVAADAVPVPTATALRGLAPGRVVVLGGSAAVQPGVLAEVQRLIAR